MKTKLQLNIIANNCEVSELTRQSLTTDLDNEITRFPGHSEIKIILSRTNEQEWTFDLSMRYGRGHVATTKSGNSLENSIESGLTQFRSDLRIHEFQWAVETFHFDKSGEYDYYTEATNGTLSMPQRKLSALIVEDDPAASVVLEATLKSLGCDVTKFDLPTEALESLKTKRFDLLVLDWNLPYMKGGDFLLAADQYLQKADRIGQPQRQVPVVICTSMQKKDLQLPIVSHFFVTNFWHKSLPFSSIFDSIDETTKKISARNKITA